MGDKGDPASGSAATRSYRAAGLGQGAAQLVVADALGSMTPNTRPMKLFVKGGYEDEDSVANGGTLSNVERQVWNHYHSPS